MPQSMPDIANSSTAEIQQTLQWVGMSDIELPIKIASADLPLTHVNAKAQAFVSLTDVNAKGIHMSRLFLALDEASDEPITPASLRATLDRFITSHRDISDQARITLHFDLPIRRKALLSDNSGWKYYPVTIDARLNQGVFELECQLDVTYSSTCPCSAALARQLIQQNFTEQFSDKDVNFEQVVQWLGTTSGISATPHSQRSVAEVKMKLSAADDEFNFKHLIDTFEGTLKTPVQTAVKREDEQEFARLNGENLMFCEDAARKLKSALNQLPEVHDFWLRINHYESLHAHDAVAIATKGVANGYQP